MVFKIHLMLSFSLMMSNIPFRKYFSRTIETDKQNPKSSTQHEKNSGKLFYLLIFFWMEKYLLKLNAKYYQFGFMNFANSTFPSQKGIYRINSHFGKIAHHLSYHVLLNFSEFSDNNSSKIFQRCLINMKIIMSA